MSLLSIIILNKVSNEGDMMMRRVEGVMQGLQKEQDNDADDHANDFDGNK